MIHIPYIFDNNKNITAVNQTMLQPRSGLESQTLYQCHEAYEVNSNNFEQIPLDNICLVNEMARQDMFNARLEHQPILPGQYHRTLGANRVVAKMFGLGANNCVLQEELSQQVTNALDTKVSYHRQQSFDDCAHQLKQLAASNAYDNIPITPSSLSTHAALSNLVNQKPSVYTKWTEEEDDLLREAVRIYGPHKWSLIATNVPNRTPMQCSARWVGALNPSILKGRWTTLEDAALTETVQHYFNLIDSQGNPQQIPWNKVSKSVPQRTGAQCQARWTEALDPRIKKGKWSSQEDILLKDGVKVYGRCWIRIAEMIEGRTQRQCRTRWLQIKNKMTKLKNENNNNSNNVVTSITAAVTAASNSSRELSNNIFMLTPPTTTPSTPAQTMMSLSPHIATMFNVMNSTEPSHVSDVSDIFGGQSPDHYQSHTFPTQITPVSSPNDHAAYHQSLAIYNYVDSNHLSDTYLI